MTGRDCDADDCAEAINIDPEEALTFAEAWIDFKGLEDVVAQARRSEQIAERRQRLLEEQGDTG